MRQKNRDGFGSCTAGIDIHDLVFVVTLGDHEEQGRTLRVCYQQAHQQSTVAVRAHFVMPDAFVTNIFSELATSTHEDLSVHSSSDVPVTLKKVTRSLHSVSWHTAQADSLAEASILAVHHVPVPPDIHVLYQDWFK